MTQNQTMLDKFCTILTEEEKAPGTIEKYCRDVQRFLQFAGEEQSFTKTLTMAYKEKIVGKYAPATAASMLAALNIFLKKLGFYECVVKTPKVQGETFRSSGRDLDKEEYQCLLKVAERQGKERLYLMMETLCATGIRVSELRFITIRALEDGCVRVTSKGKQRTVLLPASLCRKLKQYVQVQKRTEGCVFVTRNGNPVDRSNIFHEMKKLCQSAGIDKKKVFPHNLRHLFAKTYYQAKKDLSHLADLLGHSSVNTTRIYTRVSDREQWRQIDSLGLVL